MSKDNDNIAIENAKIMFRNFSGAEGKYNNAGRRNFCVFLDSEIAEVFEADGWNIRWLEPKGEYEGEEPQGYMQVSVSFDPYPPKIMMITSGGKTRLTDETINLLDWAEIEHADLIIRPYNWNVNGKTGIKAYCKSMYVTIREDEFASKYREVPDSAKNCVGDECE